MPSLFMLIKFPNHNFLLNFLNIISPILKVFTIVDSIIDEAPDDAIEYYKRRREECDVPGDLLDGNGRSQYIDINSDEWMYSSSEEEKEEEDSDYAEEEVFV